MKKIKTRFKDLFVVNTRVFKDNRGWLKEEFKKKFIKKNLVFTLVSSSKKNVLRGLHIQTKKPQDKFLSVLKGRVLDIAVDLRKNSKTYGKYFKIILSDKNGKHLFVPKSYFIEQMTYLYKNDINVISIDELYRLNFKHNNVNIKFSGSSKYKILKIFYFNTIFNVSSKLEIEPNK